MPGRRGTETEFELTTIERLEGLEYLYQHGSELDRPPDEVVLESELRRFLVDGYPDLPPEALEAAVALIRRPEGVDTIRRNMSFHQMLVRGFELAVELPDGKREHRHIYPIDWENSNRNRFLVVNQLSVRGKNDRRPDIVIYVNGLPLVLFILTSFHGIVHQPCIYIIAGRLKPVEYSRLSTFRRLAYQFLLDALCPASLCH